MALVALSVGKTVWVRFFDDADWVEATILTLGTTEAEVRQTGTMRAEWVPLSGVFDVLPRNPDRG